MKSQRVIYFKFKVNVIFQIILQQTKKSKHFVSKRSYRHSRCIIMKGFLFCTVIQINLLFRFLMSIHSFLKKFTETDLGKCISFILVKDILDQNPNKKRFRKNFLTFFMFFKFKGMILRFVFRFFFHFFLFGFQATLQNRIWAKVT